MFYRLFSLVIFYFHSTSTVSTEQVSLFVRFPKSLARVSVDLNVNAVVEVASLATGFTEELVVHLARDVNESIGYYTLRNELRSVSLEGPPKIEEIGSFEAILDDRITATAFDYVNKLMYVGISNEGPDSSARIEVCPVDGTKRRCAVILHEKLDYLHYLVLDPIDGFMYWINGVQQHIERALMSGEHHEEHPFQELEVSSLTPLSSLTLHAETRSLYYVRSPSDQSEIWRCRLSHRDSCVLVSSGKQIMHFTAVGNYLLWSSINNQVAACRAGNCEKTMAYIEGLETAEILMPLDASTQPERIEPNPCAQNNGGCSDYCLSIQFVGKCACGKAVRLMDDQKTCNPKGPDKVMFVSTMSGLFYLPLDTPARTPIQIPYEGHEAEAPHHKLYDVDWDPKKEKIYWIDSTSHKIRRSNIDGSKTEDVFAGDASFDAKALRVDPFAQTVYWYDATLGRIQVASASGKGRRTILSGLEAVQGMALDPVQGYLYWTEWTETEARVQRARLDGSGAAPLVRLPRTSWPSGLELDRGEGRLFWTESNHSIIMSATTNGTDKKRVISTHQQLLHTYGISKLDEMVYVSSVIGRSFIEVNLTQREGAVHAMHDHGIYGPLGMRAVSLQRAVSETSPCERKNGGCSHICIATPEKRADCLCPSFFELQANNRTCVRPSASLLVAFNKSISLVSMSDRGGQEDIPMPNIVETIVAVDVDHSAGSVLIASGNSSWGSISEVRLNGTMPRTVLALSGLAGISGITHDPMTRNIYWSSSVLRRIEVIDHLAANRRILAWGILPRLIVAHSPSRTLFYVNDVEKPTIMRMSFVGEQNGGTSIVTVGNVRSLTLDAKGARLFWTEKADEGSRLLSAKLDGSQQEVLFAGNRSPDHIAAIGFKLWWSDSQSGEIGVYEKKSFHTVHTGVRHIHGLQVVYSEHQEPEPSKCHSLKETNRQTHHMSHVPLCPHLCLESLPAPVCQCSDHYHLDHRNHCVPADRFIYMGSDGSILRMKLSKLPNRGVSWIQDPVVVTSIVNVGTPKALAHDVYSKTTSMVYWIDENQPNTLKVAFDNIAAHTVLVSLTDYNCTVAHSIAVDYLGSHLFLSCANKFNISSILVFKIEAHGSPWSNAFMAYVGTVVSGESTSGAQPYPTSIAVFPLLGSLFYVDAGDPRHVAIVQCGFDGRNCRQWLSKDLGEDTKLHADPHFMRLFYTSPSGVWSRDVDMPNTNVRHHYIRRDGSSPLSVAPYDDGVLVAEASEITDTGRTGETAAKEIPLLSDITAVMYVSGAAQHSSIRQCTRDDCAFICGYNRSPDNYKCLCPLGYTTSRHDARSCEPIVQCERWEFACSDGRTCVHRAARCDYIRDCPDNSDEDPMECGSVAVDRWPCEDGRGSVQRVALCDGRDDCADGSDERGCRCDRSELDCMAWPGSSDRQCLPRGKLCDGHADCGSQFDENPLLCAGVSAPMGARPGAEWLYLALFATVSLPLTALFCWCCARQKGTRNVVSEPPTCHYNGAAEATILLPPEASSGRHVELALRTYSVVDSSSSYPALPPPNQHYASSGMSSSYGYRMDDGQQVTMFYAPPPSAASLSTYGVVKPAGMRPLHDAAASRRRRRPRGGSKEPPPTYSQVEVQSVHPCYPIVVDGVGAVSPRIAHRDRGRNHSSPLSRQLHSNSCTPMSDRRRPGRLLKMPPESSETPSTSEESNADE